MTFRPRNPAHEGEVEGVPFFVLDLNKLNYAGFIPGYYFTAGTDEGEPAEDPGIETITLEGPYATLDEAVDAATAFIKSLL